MRVTKLKISTVQRQFIIEKVLRSYLDRGIIPTVEELDQQADYVLSQMKEGQTSLKPEDFKVSKGNDSSTESLQDLSNVLVTDLGILNSGLETAISKSKDIFSNTLTKLFSMIREANRQLDRATGLLLASNSNMVDSVGDSFSTSDLIDLTQTTALIDLDAKRVLAPYSSPGKSFGKVNLDIDKLRVDFSPLSRANLLSYVGTESRNAFIKSVSPWLITLKKSTGGNCTIEIKIAFDDFIEMNQIKLIPFHSSSSSTIIGLYSSDGVNYYRLPTEREYLDFTQPACWVFPLTSCKYLKFIINKTSHDRIDKVFIYEFGIQNIEFYTNSFEQESILETLPLSVEKDDGSLLEFRKVSLDTCDDIPLGTEISYYVAFVEDEDFRNFTDWIPISPVNKPGVAPVIVNVGKAKYEYSTSLGKPIDQVGHRFEQFKNLIYLDTFLDPRLRVEDLALLRNVKQEGPEPYLISQPDGNTAPRGWAFDKETYSCYVNISDPNGVTLIFGNSQVEIDGVMRSGSVDLGPGLHKIRVNPKDWYDINYIDGPIVGSVSSFTKIAKTFTLDNNQTLIDPLYPYNYKLIIEGMIYSDDFTQEIAYRNGKKDIVCAHVCTLAGQFDVAVNSLRKNDFSKFAVIEIDGKEIGMGEMAVRTCALYAVNVSDQELFILRGAIPVQSEDSLSKTVITDVGEEMVNIFDRRPPTPPDNTDSTTGQEFLNLETYEEKVNTGPDSLYSFVFDDIMDEMVLLIANKTYSE